MDQSQIAGFLVTALIALTFYLSGLLMSKFSPQDVNPLIGYRTKRSMRNKKLWNEGNRYSSQIMKQYGLVFLLVGCLISFVLKGLFIVFLLIGIMIILFISMFMRVEKRLKEIESKSE